MPGVLWRGPGCGTSARLAVSVLVMPTINWHTRYPSEPWLIRWLRRDRWFADEYAATMSRSIYALVEDRPPPDRYGTSILGVVNGYLNAIGLVIVVCWDANTGRHWLELCKKWW